MRNLAPFVAPSCGTWRPFVFPVVIVDVVVVVVVSRRGRKLVDGRLRRLLDAD